MKKILVNHRSYHHATHSGYDRLEDYITAEVISGSNPIVPYVISKQLSKFSNQSSGYYDSSSLNKELKLIKQIIGKNNEETIVHFTCAERDFKLSSRIIKLKNNVKVCGTFHKPPNILKQDFKNTKYFERYDGAIAVGKSMTDFLQSWLKIKNVIYIPHGVDTQYFKPLENSKRSKSVLFVGQHLRNFKQLNNVTKKFLKYHPDIEFHIVVNKHYVKMLNKQENVNIHSGINDDKLKLLYQKSGVLYLPLEEVTACNAILEAMACGMPIVTTNHEDSIEYLSNTENILVPKENTDSAKEAILEVLKNENKQQTMSVSSRQKVMDYNWVNIVPQIELFYKSLF